MPCFRLSGAGNDFLALAEPDAEPDGAQVRAWCRRGVSLGADGLFVLRRQGDGVRMDYYNADGAAADLCLNGTRCAGRLAVELGWANEAIDIETPSGTIRATVDGPTAIRLDLPPPTTEPQRRRLEVGTRKHAGSFLTVGVPQFVVEWPTSLGEVPIATLGAAIRRHPTFGEAGTNVMFVRTHTPDRIEMRSYERGVEAETLACGTGALAAAAVGVADDRLRPPIRVLTGGGFELTVDGRVEHGRFTRWSLTGDARLLARLEVDAAATMLPSPPVWTDD